jgi:hypothetical protein
MDRTLDLSLDETHPALGSSGGRYRISEGSLDPSNHILDSTFFLS